MRWRDTMIVLLCVVLAAGLFYVSGSQLEDINAKRKDMNLTINEPLENAPPSLAFATVALGAFRGLIVDILWLRADNLKEQGEFFDAKQLAQWITILQPRFTKVWEFHAWNMAYNISVTIPATQPEQRWQWVRNGYELLRDEAIVKNPRKIKLYQQLAWTFQHKIGGVSDDAHKYYKLALALSMQPLLGEADNAEFERLVSIPKTISELMRNEKTAKFVDALRASDEVFKDDSSIVPYYLSLRENPRRFKEETLRVLDEWSDSDGLNNFDVFARAWQLRNTWKMEPELMQEINQMYGPKDADDPNLRLPLEWRHPDAHAIYWAVKGFRECESDLSPQEISADRIILHSLQALFRRGKVFIYELSEERIKEIEESEVKPSRRGVVVTKVPDYMKDMRAVHKDIYLRPDLRMFDAYNNAAMIAMEKYKGVRIGAVEGMKEGHQNMLTNAALGFYRAGHIQSARRIYAQLRNLYPKDEYNVPLEVYLKKRIQEKFASLGIHDAREDIMFRLREAYFRYAMHDDNEAFGREKMAQEAYEYYRQSNPDDELRVRLPEFSRLRYLALKDFFEDMQYPPQLKMQLWNRISIERPELAKTLEREETKLMKEWKEQQRKKMEQTP